MVALGIWTRSALDVREQRQPGGAKKITGRLLNSPLGHDLRQTAERIPVRVANPEQCIQPHGRLRGRHGNSYLAEITSTRRRAEASGLRVRARHVDCSLRLVEVIVRLQRLAGWFIAWFVAISGPLKACDGVWRDLARMPSMRQEISAAVLDGKIFVIAGFDGSGMSRDTVEIYDPETDSWSSAARLPIATNHNAAAVAAGKLYAFAGTSKRVFVYHPDQNAWSDVAPTNYMHGDTPAVAVINDLIYVAGGSGAVGNEVEFYDPAQDAWTTLAPMNVPRNHTAGGASGGKFYVAGGRPGILAASALEVYDPQTNTWTSLSPMPTGRSGIAAGVVNNKLYVFGGEDPRLFSEVEVYDTATDSWQQLAPMRTPRHGIVAAVIGNVIYIPGGGIQQGFGATDVNEAYVVPNECP